MELTLTEQILLLAFGIAAIMGAVANKTNFCTMGAVSDWVNMGDTGRFRAWLFAIVVAMIGVLVIETAGIGSVDSTLPPYRAESFAWLRYIVGGIMFGVGMTLASGCGNKTLIRIGGGNLKSVIVLLIAGLMAYFMTNPFHSGTDQTLYGLVFFDAVSATSVNLSGGQDLGSIVAGMTGMENEVMLRTVVGGIIVLALLVYIFKSVDFRSRFDNILGGGVIGLAIVAGWYVTAGAFGQAWIADAEWLDERPINVATQSFTFINPMGESLAFFKDPSMLAVSFGMAALAGVIFGSLVYALVTRSFRFEWFSSLSDFKNHFIGAILMGIGGVLAMGCTIGQGITGVSTLALGSIIAFGSIVFGSALTMKINYYRMVYEDEAGFGKALVTSLVDMRLLPASMRKLEAV